MGLEKNLGNSINFTQERKKNDTHTRGENTSQTDLHTQSTHAKENYPNTDPHAIFGVCCSTVWPGPTSSQLKYYLYYFRVPSSHLLESLLSLGYLDQLPESR